MSTRKQMTSIRKGLGKLLPSKKTSSFAKEVQEIIKKLENGDVAGAAGMPSTIETKKRKKFEQRSNSARRIER